MGAKNIYIFATHPVFSEDAVNLLKNSVAKKVFVTDAIPINKKALFENLEVLTLAKLISNHF
jgi:ribose-phosphate pyrophosphokinase